MRKSYVTSMPDHIGAFLKASQCFALLGINITRVSYNKAVDSHTLFIDAEGTEEQLSKADEELRSIGYIQRTADQQSIILMEFCLKDVPGSVTGVLELISSFGFNISYISSQQNGTDYQLFKMGLFVDDPSRVSDFVTKAGELCKVRILDYNSAEFVYDNSIFYNSFISSISKSMMIPDSKRDELLINTNLAMQTLDERGLSPYHTFDSIGKLADYLSACRGEAFSPRITRHRISDDSEIILIEPPCGSNTAIIRSRGDTVFIDSGYACYREEMKKILGELIPEYDSMKKRVLVTHADVDHIGLCPFFDEVLASENSASCMRAEYEGKDGFREKNPLHKPYIRICKVLTSFEPVPGDKIRIMWKARPESDVPLYPVGYFDVGELSFEVYEGMGGHLKGETVLIDYQHNIVFSGDIYVNIHGMTAAQAEYNRYAPILMTSVDTEPDVCKREREALFRRLGSGDWRIFGGHGGMKEYSVGTKG